MGNWKFALVLLTCLQASHAFTCPNGNQRFYHADVSTDCQVFHLCENSQLQTLTCPSGQAFNYGTSKCEEASQVNCHETLGGYEHQHPKGTTEEIFHTIEVQEDEVKLIEAYRSIIPIIEEAFKDIAPSMYSKIEQDYLPAFRHAKTGVLPFFYDKLYPEMQHWYQHYSILIGKVIDNVYRSYELSNSNSTHVIVVSMPDIAEEVANDFQPVTHLGRYLSAKMSQTNIHTRNKREVDGFIYSLIRPLFNNALRTITDAIFGDLDSFTSKVVLPTIYDILGDAESRYNLLGLYISAKAIYAPVAWEMMQKQTFDTPECTIIKIPRRLVEDANKRFKTETAPFIRKLADKQLGKLFFRLSENVPAMLDGISQLQVAKDAHAGVLKDAVYSFITKHGDVLQSSTYSHINSYTLTEILNDLRPIKMTILQIVVEYFRNNRDSLLHMILGGDPLIQTQAVGPPIYAKLKP